jgi:hypothetical protein
MTKEDGSGNRIATIAGDAQQAQTIDFYYDATAGNMVLLNPARPYDVTIANDLTVTNDLTTGATLSAAQFNATSSSEITIVSGVATITRTWHTIDTESDASTDILTSFVASKGEIFTLTLANSARNITVTHGAPIRLADDKNFDFNSTVNTYITFLCVDEGNVCIEISRNRNITNTPFFNAYLAANQSITASTITLVNLDTVAYESNSSSFDTTNKRFTPQKAGTYLVCANWHDYHVANGKEAYVSLRKNGAILFAKQHMLGSGGASYQVHLSCSGLVQLNGTTDYVDMAVYHNEGGATNTIGGAMATYMTGFLLTGSTGL